MDRLFTTLSNYRAARIGGVRLDVKAWRNIRALEIGTLLNGLWAMSRGLVFPSRQGRGRIRLWYFLQAQSPKHTAR